jgi:hypothetical protein
LAEYRLLLAFRKLFEGTKYRHRDASLGNYVAMHLYDDLASLARSPKFVVAVGAKERVVNVQNRARGVEARRGDGTFGEIIPGEKAIGDPAYPVARGPIAIVDIGTEVKILAKAMIKQIDRVMNDLRNQVAQFRKGGGNPICVAIVGINHATQYTSYEGERAFTTTGKDGYLHPAQEAAAAEARLVRDAKSAFDEFLILKYVATNTPPFPFSWVNYEETRLDYASALTRISSKFQQRF